MGGHGGLNILPQKSWNVYNRDNRLKVQRDEEQAAREAAEASRRDAAELAERKLEEMRSRAGLPGSAGGGASSAALGLTTAGHINFFADIERAQKNAEHEAEARRAEAKAISRIMPDLQLDRSKSEPAPWYVRLPAQPAAARAPEPPAAKTSAPAALLLRGAGGSQGELEGSERKRRRDEKHEKSEKREKRSRKEKHHKRSREKHHKRHKERRKEEKREKIKSSKGSGEEAR
ncbi:hypothetical protein AB1Y20_009475 [Prymnesium parvum]|uniref:CBF1-interacting co-repressor CIR N-terminal domain-containing protein n=1 Tax=Prymnesium parvum TaxID=97485 RepID=A0AB34K258_PRYPA